jgi:hypothetical protein
MVSLLLESPTPELLGVRELDSEHSVDDMVETQAHPLLLL